MTTIFATGQDMPNVLYQILILMGGGPVVEWLMRSTQVLLVLSSRQLARGIFKNPLCSPSTKWLPDSLQRWRRWKVVGKRSTPCPSQVHHCWYKLTPSNSLPRWSMAQGQPLSLPSPNTHTHDAAVEWLEGSSLASLVRTFFKSPLCSPSNKENLILFGGGKGEMRWWRVVAAHLSYTFADTTLAGTSPTTIGNGKTFTSLPNTHALLLHSVDSRWGVEFMCQWLRV